MGLTLPFTEEKTFQFTPKERKMSQRSWAWLEYFQKDLCICIYIYLGMNSCCVRPWKAAHFLFFQRLLIKHSLQPNFNTSEVGLTVNRYLTEKARNLHFCFRAGSQISNLNANLGKPCLWKPGRQWMFCQSWKHAPLLAWLKCNFFHRLPHLHNPASNNWLMWTDAIAANLHHFMQVTW